RRQGKGTRRNLTALGPGGMMVPVTVRAQGAQRRSIRSSETGDASVDVNEADSVAFQFLRELCTLSWHRNHWCRLPRIGWDMGLSNNEIRDVIRHLASRGMLEWRSGSRGWRMSDRLKLRAIPSELGRSHVKAMLGLEGAAYSRSEMVTDNSADTSREASEE